MLVAVLIGAAGLLALGCFLLLVHGAAKLLHDRWRAARIDAARRLVREAVVAAVPSAHAPEPCAGAAAAALRRLPHIDRIDVLVELAPNLAGDAGDVVRLLARTCGVVTRAERDCTHRSWTRRLAAARVLTLFGGGQRRVPGLLDDEHPRVRAQAVEWAGRHGAGSGVAELLIALLGSERALLRSSAADALVALGSEGASALLPALAAATGHRGVGALRAAAAIRDPHFANAARERMRDPDPEIRVAAIALARAVGCEIAVQAIAARLHDADADVRAAAARALGDLGHWPAAPALVARLRDPGWLVRRDAAMALRKFGDDGVLALHEALNDPDRFARDIARQTLDLPAAAVQA